MSDDRYTHALETLESSRSALASELVSLGHTIRAALDRRSAGVTLSTVPEAMTLIAKRDGTIAALSAFGIAFADQRAEAVRALVDEEHRSIAEVARLMYLSRQVVSRIYNDRARGRS